MKSLEVVLFLRAGPLGREMLDIQISTWLRGTQQPCWVVRIGTELGPAEKPFTWVCQHVCYILGNGASPFLSRALGFLI